MIQFYTRHVLAILCEQRVMLAAQQTVASTKEVTQIKRGLVVLVFYGHVSVHQYGTTALANAADGAQKHTVLSAEQQI